MIERVARAMCAADGTAPDAMVYLGVPSIVPGGFCVHGDPAPAWHLYAHKARVALGAMREPTAEMIEAAWDCAGIADNGGSERGPPADEWAAMIDEAINPRPKPKTMTMDDYLLGARKPYQKGQKR